jgi:hypothetical protein
MDEGTSQNGTGNGKVYVKFGPLDTQEMPREWAEKMLTALKDKHPAQFGKLLAEAATGGR